MTNKLGASADAETGSREPSPTGLGPSGFDPARCRNCDGEQWVCENHQDTPWEASGHSEKCGAGAPCPVCNRDMACAPYRSHWQPIETLERAEGTVVLVTLSATAANDTYGEGGYRTVHIATFEDRCWSDSYSAYRLENRCWRVTHWMPVPEAPAIATEARRAETTGSVHEGADPQDIAHPPSSKGTKP